MRRHILIAGSAVAGITLAGALTAAGVANAGTAATGTVTGTPAAVGPGPGGVGAYGTGAGRGPGRDGVRKGGLDAVSRGTGRYPVTTRALTDAQRESLARMAEEEKLAGDLYRALAVRYPGLTVFSRIARSEASHLRAVRTLLSRYGIADPTVSRPAGSYADAGLQSLYDRLIAGATSEGAALAAGVAVERADIADLAKTRSGVTAPDVLRVLSNLARASQQHLVAFGG